MGIYCMGTTRKKALGFPSNLQGYLENNSELLWDSTIAQIVDNNTICFIWQDNKPVAAISTAYSLYRSEDRIQRLRRCPKINTENQRILRPVFQGLPFKELFIPKAIDDYNHHMKGVDQADQLRASFTCHRKQNYRTQMPLFYFLLDVSCVNAFLLWQRSSTVNATIAAKTHNTHRAFMSVVCDKLLYSNPKIKENQQEESHSQPVPTVAHSRHHTRIQDLCLSRCHWGKLHPPGCQRKKALKRKFGDDITQNTVNGASEAILGGSRTRTKCSKCQVWLCVKGDCWQQYHHSIGVNC